ncbi:MAG: NADH-quinone oxidoreductase subunit J [Planctomycetota bacterium]|nr:NADH-quinone oxidoreductase subunit J [Planctomycetota bacterium]
MMDTIGFGVVAGVSVVSALYVVRSANLIHAVLWLALTLLASAVLYAMLEAPFLAGVQVLTYVGGVVTLMIFGVMLTQRHDGTVAAASNVRNWAGVAAAIALCTLLFVAVGRSDLTTGTPPPATTTTEIGRSLLDEHLVAFEALSLLLLAAIVGAVVLARRKDHEAGDATVPTSPPSARRGAE